MMKISLPTWNTLRGLGTNRVVRSANIWAIIVPIAAKLLDKVEEVSTIVLFGHTFSIHLSLPFSWKILFFAAIAFLVANILFAALCPKLIKETVSYRDFAEQKRSCIELQTHFENPQLGILTPQWSNWFSARNVTVLVQPMQSYAPKTNDNEDRVFTDAYAIVVNALSETNSTARFFVTFFYAAGLISFGFLLIQNIIFVVQQW